MNKKVAARIKEDIDEFCVKLYDGGHRTHLGASLIGRECKRQLWYTFRWVKKEKFSGQMLRLFNRGHKEEDRFIEWLEGIGIKMWADDLENFKLLYHSGGDYEITVRSLEHPISSDDCSDSKRHIKRAKADGVEFPQYRIKDVHGHFGGSLDGVCHLPTNYQILEAVLVEMKTSNTKGFNELQKKGVVRAKPEHFAQMSTYGFKQNLNYGLYLCICKETDEIHIEVVKLDHNLGQQMIHKAEEIITSETAPPKLSFDATFYKCKWCNFNEICHNGACSEVNCRSCKHAKPAEDSEWVCSVRDKIIPKDIIVKGCESYKSITDRV